ncbi:hypothetical protein Gohar_008548 [Gossypium harknessii]|uniref:DUF4283 domain-containing protein n=1 Tax=Gossypium harknessii TaxID=34285 RepID=A0A7J9GLA9_9ROSI|nr:hypothetical protein [Gossypium harknessii]
MDLDNDYCIVKFQAKVDSKKALVEMVVYGQYLMVQPWTPSLNIHESFSMRVMVWVKLPCFPGVWYKKCLLEVMESTIGQVVRVDDNTENGYRGRFTRMTRAEYEILLNVCYEYGCFGQVKEGYLKTRAEKGTECNKKTDEQSKMPAVKQPSTMELDRQILTSLGSRFKVIANSIYEEDDSYRQMEDNMSVGVRRDDGQGLKNGSGYWSLWFWLGLRKQVDHQRKNLFW